MNRKSFTFPASFAQQRLWFLDQLDPGQSVYNMAFAVQFLTTVDHHVLEQAVNEIARRHESLRTTFNAIDGQPMQIIRPYEHVALPSIDLSECLPAEREARSKEYCER